MNQPVTPPETVLCIPGPWKDRAELLVRIFENSGEYMFAGQILMHGEFKEYFELQVEGPDPRMADAIAAAGRHWATAADLAQIASHNLVLYLVGPGGSRQRAESFMRAAAGLLKAGGMAVKVESSGIAHDRTTWLDMTKRLYLFSAHRAFVVSITGSDVYTCGMHNLGYPDAIVARAESEDPGQLVYDFSRYVFTETPTIHPGETFSASPDAPCYRLTKEECRLYEEGSLFANPYGMWRLTMIDHSPG
jgi:uncharacterized protein DUF4261